MSSRMKRTQRRKHYILANIEKHGLHISLYTYQAKWQLFLGDTAVRREIPSAFKELWEVSLLNSYSLNVTGSFELPFLKVLLTFSLKKKSDFYLCSRRWGSRFVSLFNLRRAVQRLYRDSIKPASRCCILHIRHLLVALVLFSLI